MTDRDTKFRDGFAKLLRQEIFDKLDWLDTSRQLASMDETIDTLIAERAYDLVAHTIDALWPYINDKAIEPSATDIPDLTQWPD